MHLSPTSSPPRIVAIDDSPVNLMLLETLLSGENGILECYKNPEEALSAIAQSPPHLAIVDVMMPGIDGYDVTCRLRRASHLPYIPILLITSHERSSAVRGLELGADDFIRKPICNDELLARVRSLLRLKHSIDERDAIARARTDFVSRLAHDLRVPLIAQQQMLKLMERGAFRENPQQLAQTYRRLLDSNQNLLSLVNTLLDIYRYEDGRQPLAFQSLHLNALVRSTVEELTPLAEGRNLDLSYHCDPNLPPLQGDPLELRRVIQNLVGNAIQFTEAGTIAVSTAQREQAGRSWACLRVRDTGAGIAPQDLEFIFERF